MSFEKEKLIPPGDSEYGQVPQYGSIQTGCDDDNVRPLYRASSVTSLASFSEVDYMYIIINLPRT